MDSAFQTHLLTGKPTERVPGAGAMELESAELLSFELPLLTRSVSLLRLLLEDSAIDLELASSVIGLDPGLALGTLQLANMEGSSRTAIWQLPLAVVAAGRDALEQLVARSPCLESYGRRERRTKLISLYDRSVVRACLAFLLSRELGGCLPRKTFLAGLFLGLPEIVNLTYPAHPLSAATMLSWMCRILPASVVTAALAATGEGNGGGNSGIVDPGVACVLLANAVLRTQIKNSSGARAELHAGPLWQCWGPVEERQRSFLVTHCRQAANWAYDNLQRMDPWEFMARLEHRKFWE